MALHIELERELGTEDYQTRCPQEQKRLIDRVKQAEAEVKGKKVERYEIEDSGEESRRGEETDAQVEGPGGGERTE